MEIRKNSETNMIFVRKPLQIIVRHIGDLQAHKNPFTKSTKPFSTLSPLKSATMVNQKEVAAAFMHASTIQESKKPSFPHPSSSRVPQPNILCAEIGESVTEDNCDWFSETEIDSEAETERIDEEESKESNEETIDDAIKYRAKLTKELEYNFNIIHSIPLVDSQDDVTLRQVSLPIRTKPVRLTDKTLLLDLDDTLIHTVNPNFDYSSIDVDHREYQPVWYRDASSPSFFCIKVLIRPNAIKLLEELSKLYEIIVFFFHFTKNRFSQQLKTAMQMQLLSYWTQKTGLFLIVYIVRNALLRMAISLRTLES